MNMDIEILCFHDNYDIELDEAIISFIMPLTNNDLLDPFS